YDARFYYKQKTAYEIEMLLEFRRVLFRSISEFAVTTKHFSSLYKAGKRYCSINASFVVFKKAISIIVTVLLFISDIFCNLSLPNKTILTNNPLCLMNLTIL